MRDMPAGRKRVDESPRVLSKVRLVVFTLAIAAGAPQAASPAQIEEILVTAQKRPQPEQDVGAAVFALDAAAIDASMIRQGYDLTTHVPNVDIKNSQGNTTPIFTIRGVGLNDFVANNDQSAGIYVDEVFLASPAMMGFLAFDLERTEVLLGPQGTLYGRNTTAGAINFISNKPGRDHAAQVEVGYGNYERLQLEGMINAPLADDLAGRLSMTGDWSGQGHFRNSFTGADYGTLSRWAARGQLQWKPSAETGLLLNLHGGRDRSDALSNWIAVGIMDADASSICAPALAGDMAGTVARCADLLGYQDRDGDPYTGAWNLEPRNDTAQYGLTLTANGRFFGATLTSVSAFESFDRFIEEEADGSPATSLHIESDYLIEQFSQELRLASTEPLALPALPGGVDWLAGAFLHRDRRVGAPSQRFDLRDLFNDALFVEWDQETESAALFSQLQWQPAAAWNFILGGRYTRERKDFYSNSENTLPYGGVSGLTGSSATFSNSRDNRISDGEIAGTAGIEYRRAENLLAYLKYSKGFKSGGFSGLLAGTREELDPYDEEELYAWEAGLKTSFLERSLRFNVSLFHYDYRDMQVFAIPLDSAVQVPRITNSEKARVLGMDASLRWQPLDGLQLTSNVGWLDHENRDPRFYGLDLPNAPKFSFSQIFQYRRLLPNGLSVSPRLHAYFQKEAFKTVENRPLLKSGDYWLIDAGLTLQSGDGWNLDLWVRNLLDQDYVVEAFDQSGFGYLIYNYGMPRTYGASLSFRWR